MMRRSLRWLWDNGTVIRGWGSGLAVAMILWVFIHPAIGVIAGGIVASVLLFLPPYLAGRHHRPRGPK